jgi:hypothetical protein
MDTIGPQRQGDVDSVVDYDSSTKFASDPQSNFCLRVKLRRGIDLFSQLNQADASLAQQGDLFSV